MAARTAKPRASRAKVAAPEVEPPVAPAPAAPPPPPEPGTWRIEQLRSGQCRFACTPDDVPRGGHRFCGCPTSISARNINGSWCDEHLPRVMEPKATLGRPVHLRRTARELMR